MNQQPKLPRTSEKIARKKPIRIVAWGDSISEVGRTPDWHGGASAPEKNWAQQLGVMLRGEFPGVKFTMINAGIGGQNSYEGLGRLDSMEALKPDLVLVEFGANDCAYHFLMPQESKLALTTMGASIVHRFGADIAFVATAGDNPEEPFFRQLHKMIEVTAEAARDNNAPFIDLRQPILQATANGLHWADFHLDSGNCHPNDNGHELWARAVFEGLVAVWRKTE